MTACATIGENLFNAEIESWDMRKGEEKMTKDERQESFCLQGKAQGEKKLREFRKKHIQRTDVGTSWVEFRRFK